MTRRRRGCGRCAKRRGWVVEGGRGGGPGAVLQAPVETADRGPRRAVAAERSDAGGPRWVSRASGSSSSCRVVSRKESDSFQGGAGVDFGRSGMGFLRARQVLGGRVALPAGGVCLVRGGAVLPFQGGPYSGLARLAPGPH